MESEHPKKTKFQENQGSALQNPPCIEIEIENSEKLLIFAQIFRMTLGQSPKAILCQDNLDPFQKIGKFIKFGIKQHSHRKPWDTPKSPPCVKIISFSCIKLAKTEILE